MQPAPEMRIIQLTFWRLKSTWLTKTPLFRRRTAQKATVKTEKPAFSYLCDIDYGKVGSYFFCYSASGGPEEIAVIHLKNASDVEEANLAVKKHVEWQEKRFLKNTTPKAAAALEQALVFSDGNRRRFDSLLLAYDYKKRIRTGKKQRRIILWEEKKEK